MKRVLAVAAILAAGPAYPSFAEDLTPATKIIGNGLEPQSQDMVLRGYTPVKENYWWDAAKRQCAYLPPAGAEPVAVRPAICGMAVRVNAAPADSCPVRLAPDQQARYSSCPLSMAGR